MDRKMDGQRTGPSVCLLRRRTRTDDSETFLLLLSQEKSALKQTVCLLLEVSGTHQLLSPCSHRSGSEPEAAEANPLERSLCFDSRGWIAADVLHR